METMGPQCTECGRYNDCNHGAEPDLTPEEEAEHNRALAERYEAQRDARRFGDDRMVVRHGR